MANGNDGIDTDYFNEVAGLEPETIVDTQTSNNNGAGQDATQQQSDSTADQGTGEDRSTSQQTETNQSHAGEQQVPQREQQNGKPAQANAPLEGLRRYHLGNYLNANGDIVNDKGEIIAQKGSQRRLHDENTRLRRDSEALSREVEELRRYRQETSFLNGIPQQYGLTNDEVAHALDLRTRIKRGDVQGVAREVTAMLAAKGIPVSAILGKDVGDSVDMMAVRAMIDEGLRPVRQQETATREQQEARERASRDYNSFIRNNEYADVQGDVIVAYRNKHGVTLQQAYNDVRSFMIQNNFDMSIPLGPQLEERVAQMQSQQTQQTQQHERRPMPSGGTRFNGVEPMKPVYADPDDSWSSIINNAIKQDQQRAN